MAKSGAGAFAPYLERSLALLEREAPVHFAATRRALGGRAVAITIGAAHSVSVCLEQVAPWVRRGDAGEVEVAAALPDLNALLRGEFTIEEGLDAGRLSVRGALDHVLAFLDALTAWLHGAMRTGSLTELHRNFLAGHDLVPTTDTRPTNTGARR